MRIATGTGKPLAQVARDLRINETTLASWVSRARRSGTGVGGRGESVQADLQHRQHAVVEQVIADGKSGALAHLQSGNVQSNAACLILWAIAFNLLRAASTLAGTFHARATTATLRSHLVNIPARIACSQQRVGELEEHIRPLVQTLVELDPKAGQDAHSISRERVNRETHRQRPFSRTL